MSTCQTCEQIREQLKEQNRNTRLENTKHQAENYAKSENLKKIIVYQRKNGSYSYCTEQGWQSKNKSFKPVEVMFFNG